MSKGVGVLDQASGTGIAEIHTEDAVAVDVTTGTPLREQVVQIEATRAMAQIIALLTSIDERLATLQEVQAGYTT